MPPSIGNRLHASQNEKQTKHKKLPETAEKVADINITTNNSEADNYGSADGSIGIVDIVPVTEANESLTNRSVMNEE